MSIASSPVIARHVGNMSWQSHTLLPTLFVFFTLSLLPTSLLLYFTKSHNNRDGFLFYRFLGSQTVNLPLSDEEKFLLMVNPLLSSFFVIANLPKAGVAISSPIPPTLFAYSHTSPCIFAFYSHTSHCSIILRHCEACWRHAAAISYTYTCIFAFFLFHLFLHFYSQNTKYQRPLTFLPTSLHFALV